MVVPGSVWELKRSGKIVMITQLSIKAGSVDEPLWEWIELYPGNAIAVSPWYEYVFTEFCENIS